MTHRPQTEFERLVEAHRPQIHAYCARRIAGDAVDDAVAEVFTVAWRKRDAVPTGGATLPWLYGIARRVVQHEWRRAGRRARLTARAAALPGERAANPAEQAVADEDRRLVLEAAARLGEDDREILRLTLWEELTPTDAALVLGISADAAKQRASRARRRLADEFNRAGRPARRRGLTTGDVHR